MIKDNELALKVFNKYVQRKHLVEHPEKDFFTSYIRIGSKYDDKIVVSRIRRGFFSGSDYKISIYTDVDVKLEIDKETFNIMWESANKAYEEHVENLISSVEDVEQQRYNKLKEKYDEEKRL